MRGWGRGRVGGGGRWGGERNEREVGEVYPDGTFATFPAACIGASSMALIPRVIPRQ